MLYQVKGFFLAWGFMHQLRTGNTIILWKAHNATEPNDWLLWTMAVCIQNLVSVWISYNVLWKESEVMVNNSTNINKTNNHHWCIKPQARKKPFLDKHVGNWNKYSVQILVLNTTFNNISVILWRSVLLVKETVVPGENHRPVASHWQTLSHNVVSSRPRLSRIQTLNVSGENTQHFCTLEVKGN
jgi:hypothetical protein